MHRMRRHRPLRRTLRRSARLVLAIALVAGYAHAPARDRVASAATPAAATGHVARWVDGDTLHATLAGRDVTVRLLGAGAPETHRSLQCGGIAATKLARRLLPIGTRIIVRTDAASGDVVDVHGRRLAYVDGPRGDVGEALIRAGRATVYRYDRRRFSRLARYRAADHAARKARRGSWRTCPAFASSDDADK